MKIAHPAPQSPFDPGSGTHRAILAAASDRFGRFGPRKTSMNEIARDAGIARATLYLHFRSKEEIYAVLLDRQIDHFLSAVAEIAEGRDTAPQKLRRIVRTTHLVYADNPVLLGALTGDPDMVVMPIAAAVMRRHEQEIMAVLRQVLEQGMAEGSLRAIDPEATAYLMYQLGNLLLVREISGEAEYPFERILTAMDNIVAYGIVHGQPHSESAQKKRPTGAERWK